MKRELLLGLPLAAAMTLFSHAQSVTDNFESYTLGTKITTNGWEGWLGDNSYAGYSSTDHAFSGTKSIKIPDASCDAAHTFTGITSGKWTYKIKQYIPSSANGTICVDLYSLAGVEWGVEMLCNTVTGKVNHDVGPAADDLTLIKDAWVEIRFEIDLDGNTVSEYYNNQLLSSHSWTGRSALTYTDLFPYPGDGPAYYDDLSVAPYTPPPHGTSDSWAADVAGSWSDVSKWTSGTQYPDAVGNVATFSLDLSTGRTISLDTSVTLGQLILNDPTVTGSQNQLSGSGFDISMGNYNITMDTGTAGYNSSDLAVINVESSGANIGHRLDNGTGKLILTDNTQFNVGGGVEFGLGNGILSGAGNLIKTGTGQLLVTNDNSAYSGNIRIENGTFQTRGSALAFGTGTITWVNTGGLSFNNYGVGYTPPTFANNLVLEKSSSLSSDFWVYAINTNYNWSGNISSVNTAAGDGQSLSVNYSTAVTNYNSGKAYNMINLTGNNTGLKFDSTHGFLLGNNYIGVGNANALGTGNDALVTITNQQVSQSGVLATLTGISISSPILVQAQGNMAAAVIGANVSSGTVSYSGAITLNSNDNNNDRMAFLRADTGSDVVFTSAFANKSGGTNGAYMPLAKIGGGRVELNSASTYLGNSSARSGDLVLGNSSALGSATTAVNLGEATSVMTSVRVATLGNASIGTFTVDGTYNGTLTGAPTILDGVTLANGDRVLVKDNGTQNGIYVVQTPTSTWVRASDLKTSGQLAYGQQVAVTAGTVNTGSVYFQASRGSGPYPGSLIINSAALDYHLDVTNPNVAILNNGVTISRDINVVANGSSGKSTLGGINTTGTSTFSGNVALSRDLTVTAASGGSVAFSGNISGGYGVTKEGPGTVVFSTAKAYTGATTVSAGTLSLSQATLDDTAATTVVSGAYLNLNFSGYDRVGTLTLNGTLHTSGIYDSSNSGGLITGTGKLVVGTTPLNSYSTWMSTNYPGITGADAAVTANPSHDGISNLVKYALDLNPTVSTQPAGTHTGSSLSFTKGTMAKGDSAITYSIEESTDLVTWGAPTLGSATNGADTISYTFPSGQTKVFARLKVTQTP